MAINRVMGTGAIVLPEPSPVFGGTYTASMGNSEFTSGRWLNGLTDGLDWTDCQVISGIAYGTQTGDAPGSGHPNYNDSVSVVTGCWGYDQSITATAKTINQDSVSLNELGLRLRTCVGPHWMTGYEIGWSVRSSGFYGGVTRFNGPLNSFTSDSGAGWTATHINDNDVVFVGIVGNIITAKVNGATVGTVDITGIAGGINYTSGFPGINIWRNNNGVGTVNQTDFGWRAWSATGF